MRTVLILLISFLTLTQSQTKNPSVWKVELPEDVKMIRPIEGGKYLFLRSDEFAWLYETHSGKKTWSVKIEEYSDKSVHDLAYDSLYLVANEDTLECYSIRQNAVLWKKQYQAIEQDRFSGIQLIDTIAILSFRDIDLAVNIMTGKELWRSSVEYQTDLKENGTVNSIILPKAQKYIVFTGNDEIVLTSLATGKTAYSRKKSEPNGDLIKQKRHWFYVSPDERFVLFVMDNGVLALNVETGKEIGFFPIDINEQYNVLIPTPAGCMVIGSEKILHVNFVNGKTGEVSADIDDMRNIVVVPVDSGLIAIVSLDDKMIGLDLGTGKMIWQTGEKNPLTKGFVHQFVTSGANLVVVTYLDPSDDLKLYVMSIDAFTGKINYRTLVAHADESLPNRGLPLKVQSLPVSFDNSFFGFGNAGFRYSANSDSAKVRILVHTSSDMIEPNTKNDGGEGYAIVDIATGKVDKKQYMKIGHGLSFDGGFSALAQPLTVGSMKILPGNKNLIALDTADGSLRWMLIEQDLNKTYVLDMAVVDSLLLIRTGGSKTEYTFDEKKKKIGSKKLWEEDDYALIAADVNSGKVFWKKEFDSDPAALFPAYSISGYVMNNGTLLYGTEKFLYAQSLQKKKPDSLQWRFEFADSGVGSFSYDELFGPASRWENEKISVPDSMRYFTDANTRFSEKVIAGEKFSEGVERVLQVNYHPSSGTVIAIGEDGIASIDPGTGKRKWLYEWNYSDDAVAYRPVFLKNSLFYFVNGKAQVLDLKTGKITASVEADKESGLFIMPDASCVVVVYKDAITGLLIP